MHNSSTVLSLLAAAAMAAMPVANAADAATPNAANWHRHHHHHPQTSAGVLALSAATYSAPSKAASVTISVARNGGATGAVSVAYGTASGTAKAGTVFTAANGTLTWADGDTAAKSFAVQLISGASFTGSEEFTVALSGAAGGATLGSPAAATVTVAGSATTTPPTPPTPPTPTPSTIALGSATFSVAANSGSVSIPVNRAGGSTTAVSVSFATQNGTAVSGTDFTATSGTLSWAAGDTSAKTISVPILAKSAGNKSFTVTLSGATGATLGSATATVTIAAVTTTPATGLAVKVSGNHLVDASGKTLQLRGTNVSGLEFVAEQGFSPTNPWGSQTGTATPNWTTIAGWHINAVRLPLNQSSYLQTSCVLGTGATKNPDPGANYVATVKKSVDDATAAGLYVILDLHISAPANFCAAQQNPIADAANSNTFWTNVASAFKSYPNVMFELFNEPYLEDYAGWSGSRTAAWTGLRDGVTETQYVSSSSANSSATWQTAGLQSLLNSIRATGATNVVLASGLNWSRDLYQWNTYKPNDPLQQLAAVWHAYPAGGSGTPNVEASSFGGIDDYAVAEGILAAGVPVVITELGDTSANGATSAPFASKVAPWADAHSVSYFPWTWDTWGASSNDLIKDAAGTPTDGLGTYYKTHLACVAAGTANCP